MAEKVAKVGVKRESGFLYYLRGNEVWRSPMKRGGGKAGSTESQAEKVADAPFKREATYLYFIDAEGDISRSQRTKKGS